MDLLIAIVIMVLIGAVADHYYCFACSHWRELLAADSDSSSRFCPVCLEDREFRLR